MFEIYELRLLIDAVSSARFITKNETEKIIEKLKTLTSRGLSKKLENRIHLGDMVKSENGKIKYYLDTLHSAISENKKVSFQYGNYNVNKEFIIHGNGELYMVQPYALVWNNDFYYLVAFDERKKSIVHFRVDRMVSVSIEDEIFKKPEFDIAKHLKQSFNMYPGKEDFIEIQFKNKLINAVIDRFGVNMSSWKANDESFIISFKAAINEGLLRWILM